MQQYNLLLQAILRNGRGINAVSPMIPLTDPPVVVQVPALPQIPVPSPLQAQALMPSTGNDAW